MIERIESLYALRVHERMADFPDDLLRPATPDGWQVGRPQPVR
jgi:hypothetical protein